MRYKRLGGSGVMTSEIGFGAWTIGLGWWGKEISEQEAERMLKKAYDLGINFFETGDIYGSGKSERIIGRTFAGMRDQVVLSTKYGYDYSRNQVGHAEMPQYFDEKFTRSALQGSLERLQTDHVDVYGPHNPKMNHLRDGDMFRILASLKREGKATACQAALGPAIGWAAEGVECMRHPEIDAVQTVYNILEQDPGNALLEEAGKTGTGILTRVPDASGILTGKVTADTKISEKDHRSVRKGEWIRHSLQKVEQLRPIAERSGLSITELAIKFILSKDSVSSVLPTATSVEEVEGFAAMSDGRYVGRRDMDEITRVFESWPKYELKATIP